jgi:hypothetical protein
VNEIDSYLVWSNQKGMWWRDNHSGYTQVIDEAGRYTHAEAQDIVKSATCDYALKIERTDPISGVVYESFDEVLVPAPESVEVPW